jgi:DNA-binding Xre family transcriptional regulator
MREERSSPASAQVQADCSPALRSRMQSAGISTWKALSQCAGISEHQITLIRRGAIAQVRLQSLLQLSHTLQIDLTELLETCGSPSVSPGHTARKPHGRAADTGLQQEYDRLQTQLLQQRTQLWQEFQRNGVQTLESLILQLPTALHAAEQNPQLSATKLAPLLRPLDRLLAEWGLETIAAVGAIVAYAPHEHQLLEGSALPGDPVKVRYVGYRHGPVLLYRAKVSPVQV